MNLGYKYLHYFHAFMDGIIQSQKALLDPVHRKAAALDFIMCVCMTAPLNPVLRGCVFIYLWLYRCIVEQATVLQPFAQLSFFMLWDVKGLH